MNWESKSQGSESGLEPHCWGALWQVTAASWASRGALLLFGELEWLTFSGDSYTTGGSMQKCIFCMKCHTPRGLFAAWWRGVGMPSHSADHGPELVPEVCTRYWVSFHMVVEPEGMWPGNFTYQLAITGGRTGLRTSFQAVIYKDPNHLGVVSTEAH